MTFSLIIAESLEFDASRHRILCPSFIQYRSEIYHLDVCLNGVGDFTEADVLVGAMAAGAVAGA